MARKDWEDLETMVRLNKFRGRVSRETLWKVGDFGPQLEIVVDVVSVTDPPETYYPQTRLWYAVGAKDWSILEGGLRIQGARPDQKFHANSKYGMLMKSAAELDVAEILEGDPKDVTVWWDHIFDFDRQALEFKGLKNKSGEARDVETTIVVLQAYIGKETAEGVQVASASGTDGAIDSGLASQLAEVMHGKSEQAGRIAVVRNATLSGNDAFMTQFTNDQGFKAIMAQMESSGLLKKVGDIWQKAG